MFSLELTADQYVTMVVALAFIEVKHEDWQLGKECGALLEEIERQAGLTGTVSKQYNQ